MQKIYVLLRNDRQTGPYSLDEIIQFDLKPYDLIWIQGRSAGWYYPQEIAALHPYLSFLPKKQAPVAKATPPFVAMPSASQPVDTLPPPDPSMHSREEAVHRIPAPPAPALEEAVFAQFRAQPEPVHTPGRLAPSPTTKPRKQVNPTVLGLTIVFIVGGVFAASWIMNRQDKEVTETPVEYIADPLAQAEISGAADQQDDSNQKTVSLQQNVSKKTTTRRTPKQATSVANSPVNIESAPILENVDGEIVREQKAGPDKEPPATTTGEEATEEKEAENAAPQEKKKKLRDKIFDIFRKKPETSGAEEPRPAEESTGGRTASRREESANLAQMVHVRFTIPNEWMMGIHGAKATLVNRGSVTVQKATVEVQYFDDDNQLLQKKTISFDKVSGKDSKTVSIPDHPTATKVEYSVVSVSGKPAA